MTCGYLGRVRTPAVILKHYRLLSSSPPYGVWVEIFKHFWVLFVIELNIFQTLLISSVSSAFLNNCEVHCFVPLCFDGCLLRRIRYVFLFLYWNFVKLDFSKDYIIFGVFSITYLKIYCLFRLNIFNGFDRIFLNIDFQFFKNIVLFNYKFKFLLSKPEIYSLLYLSEKKMSFQPTVYRCWQIR